MRVGLAVTLSWLLIGVGLARAQSDVTGEPSEAQPVIIDTPADSKKPPVRDAFTPPKDLPPPVPAVRARFQSQTRGISFFLKGGTIFARDVGLAPSYGVRIDQVGVSHRPGFGVYSGKTTTKDYDLICEAPCEASLAWGHYWMALSLDGGVPVPVDEPVGVYSASIIDGRYVNRAPMRKAGWAVFGAGFIAGVVMMIAGLKVTEEGGFESVKNATLFGTGLALMGASILIGVPMLTRDDRAYITAYPMK